ncbi:hypothetical protein CLOBOL_06567 [Enterocloster bolteae ATCC BAA-613]|uniref:Uncharacterized protein n=1 Tax=Enterocloster bolteae (strain ATCC BAA-613 / DSM 15670 / CCUG 46953 / JCM 12243 / WAL 16351) TaxID=411902 RepID=A8S3C4_ENTBW|nr:hypothetical protein CLOBOL_06567 [Enterocloster bolteae ATCC BAA-613]
MTYGHSYYSHSSLFYSHFCQSSLYLYPLHGIIHLLIIATEKPGFTDFNSQKEDKP